MAKYCEWKCDSCGYAVETSGPHEFYLDAQGERQHCGHPVPRSEEAEGAGVAGLTTVAYCPVCHKVFEIVVELFDPPCNFITCWLGSHNLIVPSYQECSSTLLNELPDVPCTRCANGTSESGVVKVTSRCTAAPGRLLAPASKLGDGPGCLGHRHAAIRAAIGASRLPP